MLDDRKLAILTEIVDYYINSAEPIGSRTLSKNPSIGLSSATIRNEMSDLEELGFLMKTHISSGRIPSDKAYREYVNYFFDDGIKLNENYIKSLNESLDLCSSSLKDFYETANRLLSQKTNYITVIVSPIANSYTIEYVKLELLNSNRLLFVLVGKHGDTASYVLDNSGISEETSILVLDETIKSLILNRDSNYIKEKLDNFSSDFPNREFYINVLEKALEFLKKQNSYNVFLNGIGNIINYWKEDRQVKSLIDFLEDDKNLIKMSLKNEIDKILDIKIGEENEVDILHNSSLISSQYENTIGEKGNIILIGPTRMDYKKISNILYNFSKALSGFK